MTQYPPSMQASSAIYVAMRITLTDTIKRLGQDPSIASVSCWSPAMQEHTGYTSIEVRSCAKDYFQLLDIMHSNKDLKNLYKKFSQEKYLEVAHFMRSVMARHNAAN